MVILKSSDDDSLGIFKMLLEYLFSQGCNKNSKSGYKNKFSYLKLLLIHRNENGSKL